MPRRVPEATKRAAIGILEIHDDISLTHYLTGVHRRTLRHWRKELRQGKNQFLSEKTFSSDRKRSGKRHFGPESANLRSSRRQA